MVSKDLELDEVIQRINVNEEEGQGHMLKYSSIKRMGDEEKLIRKSEKEQPKSWKKYKNMFGTGSQAKDLY